MNGCLSCIDNAEHAYYAQQRMEAALRCCESGHKPAYKRGRYAARDEARRNSRLAYENGIRVGSIRALVVVTGLGLVALVLGRRP